jgi:hypothetical protein
LLFSGGCSQVKQVVVNVTEGVKGIFKKDKEGTNKTPAETQESKSNQETENSNQGTTTEEDTPPARTKIRETKKTHSSKKRSSNTTTTPAGEAFGPR